MAFQAAKCPNCNGELQVPDDRDIVKCMYCGNDIVVREAIKLVLGINVINTMSLADASIKSGNFQEANIYYTKILENDVNNADAWFGKGLSAGWMSTLAKFRTDEMITNFESAFQYCEDNRKDIMKEKAVNEIINISIAILSLSENHYNEFIDLDDSLYDFAEHCLYIIDSLEKAYIIKPTKTTLEWILHICDKFKGTDYFPIFEKIIVTNSKELQKY